jgi:phage shock protein PspC (stress-responsive transcriptional regulator)
MENEKRNWRFRRSRNKELAGICGGIAEGFGWNPFLVRLGYVVFTIATAILPGIIFYLLLWLAMPPAEENQ